MAVAAELAAEVEAAAKNGSPERRLRMLQEVTDLFVAGAKQFQPQQVGLFDDVLARLVERIDARALSRISDALAELPAAPQETVRRLARHEDGAVAAPVLRKSPCLSDADLREIACTRSQQHLLAIAARPFLDEVLTELIVKRAGKETARMLAKNPGVRFSEKGYAALVAIAERDDTIAESLGQRPDLPEAALRKLLSITTDIVRARLLKVAPREQREKIKAAIDCVAARHGGSRAAQPADYSEALSMVDALNRIGKLNDSTVNGFAIRGEHANLVAALSVLSGARLEVIEPLLEGGGCEGLITACRACRLNWQTTLAVITSRRRARQLSKEQLELGKTLFETLYVSAAQYTMRFEPPAPSSAKTEKTHHALATTEVSQ